MSPGVKNGMQRRVHRPLYMKRFKSGLKNESHRNLLMSPLGSYEQTLKCFKQAFLKIQRTDFEAFQKLCKVLIATLYTVAAGIYCELLKRFI
jgi:hypothetical protein